MTKSFSPTGMCLLCILGMSLIFSTNAAYPQIVTVTTSDAISTDTMVEPPKDKKLIVGVVDHRMLTRGELDKKIDLILAGNIPPEKRSDVIRRMFEGKLLDEWIDTVLLAEEARRQGLYLSDAEVRDKLEALKKQQDVAGSLEDNLLEKGVDPKKFLSTMKDAFLGEMLVYKYIDEKYPDEKMEELYNKDPSRFAIIPSIRLSQIFKAYRDKDGNSRDLAKLQTQMEKIRTKLLKGADLAKLAKKESESIGADKGGDMGWFYSPQTLPHPASPQLDGPRWARLFTLQKGEISEILRSKVGFHVIKLTDKEAPESGNFASIKPFIMADLFNAARKDLLEVSRKKHLIITNLSGLTGTQVEAMAVKATLLAP